MASVKKLITAAMVKALASDSPVSDSLKMAIQEILQGPYDLAVMASAWADVSQTLVDGLVAMSLSENGITGNNPSNDTSANGTSPDSNSTAHPTSPGKDTTSTSLIPKVDNVPQVQVPTFSPDKWVWIRAELINSLTIFNLSKIITTDDEVVTNVDVMTNMLCLPPMP